MKKKVWINGFEFWVDDNKRLIYTSETQEVGTSYDCMTPNERQQVHNQLTYKTEQQFYANK